MIISATAAAQNTPAGPGSATVQSTSTQNRWLFFVHMFFLAGSAILTLLFWQSGNKVQDAILAEANARIKEADSKGAAANERAKKLEADNLTLRAELNTDAGQPAILEKNALDAKSAQQAVGTELASLPSP